MTTMRRKGKPWLMEEDKVLGILCARMTAEDLAKQLGRSVDAVRRRMWELGLFRQASTHVRRIGEKATRPAMRSKGDAIVQAAPKFNAYWAARVRAAQALRAANPAFTFYDLAEALDAVDAQWEEL